MCIRDRYDGGVNVKHLGAMVKNARDFIGGTRQMVNKDTEGAGMLQVDKDTGRIDSTKKDKNTKRKEEELPHLAVAATTATFTTPLALSSQEAW